MATVTHNAQCFQIDGRKIWVLGATLHYARIPPELWAERIAAAKQAGFNAVDTFCPWSLHEPRQKRYNFEGQADIKRFVELCREQGMYVVLRPGPYISNGYDGGGLPAWLLELPDARLREAEETFRGAMAGYFRRLFAQLTGLQVTDGGPIVLVQAEHAWLSSNSAQHDAYLVEVVRILRENGVRVPIINANDLWQEVTGTIDTWRGWSDLLIHMRQFRSVNPSIPQMVSQFDPATVCCWGDDQPQLKSPQETVWHLAEVLAAGSQFIVSPFHAGTCFGFEAGRLPGREHGTVTPTAAWDAPLGEAGQRTEKYHLLRRLVTFANHFKHIFTDLESDYQPAAVDVSELPPAHSNSGGRSDLRGVSIVPQRGSNGRVIFAFSDGNTRSTTILLDGGLKMPVYFGQLPVTWFVLDADLGGAGRLNYTNLCPFAVLNRKVVILHGPARTPALLSISGTPIETTVPGGAKPTILHERGLTIVICNEQQIDQCYFSDTHVYFGINGLTVEGEPIASDAKRSLVMEIASEATPVTLTGTDQVSVPEKARSVTPNDWRMATSLDQVNGSSPRFASLAGPATLASCGALEGYGWFRITLNSGSGRKRLCHIPAAGDRVHMFLNAEPVHLLGIGPGAERMPFDLKMARGQHTIVALVDNFGRFAGGNDMGQVKGVADHIYEVKSLGNVRPKKIEHDIADPFEMRGYLAHRARGVRGDTRQVSWTFTHQKKAPIVVEVRDADLSGVFLLNDHPIGYYAGITGAKRLCMVLDPASEIFKRGRNELRFAPDIHVEDPQGIISEAVTLYETIDVVTSQAQWSFAKWEAPPRSSFDKFKLTEAKVRSSVTNNLPCWWMGRFTVPDADIPCWLDVSGLSKGQAYINGENLGRYFTSTATGKPVGPQMRLFVPESWLKAGGVNTITLFDEHGFSPEKVRVIRNRSG